MMESFDKLILEVKEYFSLVRKEFNLDFSLDGDFSEITFSFDELFNLKQLIGKPELFIKSLCGIIFNKVFSSVSSFYSLIFGFIQPPVYFSVSKEVEYFRKKLEEDKDYSKNLLEIEKRLIFLRRNFDSNIYYSSKTLNVELLNKIMKELKKIREEIKKVNNFYAKGVFEFWKKEYSKTSKEEHREYLG